MATGIATFARVRYPEIYPGVDAVLYGAGRQLESTSSVFSGRGSGAIRVTFDGVEGARVDNAGELELLVGGRTIRYTKPVAYQELDTSRRTVPASYVLDGTTVQFHVGAYHAARPLVIDPVLVYDLFRRLGG